MVIKKRKFHKPLARVRLRKRGENSDQTIFFSFFLGVLILATVFFLLFSNWQIQRKRSELNTKLENLKRELEVLEGEKKELSEKISEVPTEEHLEKEAREKLNLKKPGEEVVVVLTPEEEQKQKEEEKKNFFERWLERIKSKF